MNPSAHSLGERGDARLLGQSPSSVLEETSSDASQRGSVARRLSLKPYGDELLTRGGDFWIFSARLIIFAMALAEGLAWGYMGSLMSREYPLVTGLVAGIFVFTLIWIIDASFMTLDLSRAHYDRLLLGREVNPTGEKLKVAAGVIARVAIVSASLIITAPFLAQAIFSADVQDEMARRNAAMVAERRAAVAAPYLERMETLQQEQRTLEDQRVREAAGTGLSGRYGRGPALETIERQLDDKRAEIVALESARTSALAGFDALTPEQLAGQYGLRFMTSGIQSSSELLGDMMKDPQFTNAERAVQAFLAFLFLGLLILKGFQPRSIAIYYSERLHSIHDEYRKGLFDAWLPQAERAGSGGSIDPLRFEDWCLTSYRAIRGEDEGRVSRSREARIHEMRIEQWKALESATLAELEPVLRRHAELGDEIHSVEGQLMRARAEGSASTADLQALDGKRASISGLIERGGVDGATFEQAIAAQRDLDRRREPLLSALRENGMLVAELERRIARLTIEQEAMNAEIASKRMVIADVQRRIGEARIGLAAKVGEAGN